MGLNGYNYAYENHSYNILADNFIKYITKTDRINAT